jgi:hypothetical protein
VCRYTGLTNISAPGDVMSTVPTAQYTKDPEPVGFHGQRPPQYDQPIGPAHHVPYPQPTAAPYTQNNGKFALNFMYVKQII